MPSPGVLLAEQPTLTITPPPPCFRVGTTQADTICSPLQRLTTRMWTDQTEVRISLGLMSILCISLPKSFFFFIFFSSSFLYNLSVVVSVQQFDPPGFE